jgi:4-alpha-glucanotransferase
MYDLVRLDHFRAFSAFWEVSANEKTARNGVWKEGPGSDFFNKIKIELGELPFVAEDLGDIDKPVYALRDEFELPGMKVLQFAFGEDMPKSLNSPHNYTENYIVYTGTHDNNTTVGWFKNASNEIAQQQLEQYSGVSANEKNVHEILSRIAYASVAKIAILPMQDVLGTDETTRMNTPASVENNWSWRLPTGAISSEQERLLGAWVKLFNRD